MRNKIQDVMRRRAAGEKGFTLVELLVVVVILIVLSAIAVPIFLNQKTKADNAAAKSNIAAVAGTIKNGTGIGDDVLIQTQLAGASQLVTGVSYQGDTGNQNISGGGARLTTAAAAVAADAAYTGSPSGFGLIVDDSSDAWTLTQVGGTGCTWTMTSTDTKPSGVGC